MLELNTEIPSKYLAANAGPDKSKSKPRASTIDNEWATILILREKRERTQAGVWFSRGEIYRSLMGEYGIGFGASEKVIKLIINNNNNK